MADRMVRGSGCERRGGGGGGGGDDQRSDAEGAEDKDRGVTGDLGTIMMHKLGRSRCVALTSTPEVLSAQKWHWGAADLCAVW